MKDQQRQANEWLLPFKWLYKARDLLWNWRTHPWTWGLRVFYLFPSWHTPGKMLYDLGHYILILRTSESELKYIIEKIRLEGIQSFQSSTLSTSRFVRALSRIGCTVTPKSQKRIFHPICHVFKITIAVCMSGLNKTLLFMLAKMFISKQNK